MFRSTILLFILFCATVTSFTPSSQLTFAQHNSECVSSSPQRSFVLPQLMGTTDDEHMEGKISLVQRVSILAYRFSLAVSALLISELALAHSEFLEGSGMVLDDNLSRPYLPVAAGLSLLLGPVPEGTIKAGTTIFGLMTIASGLASILLSSPNDPSIGNIAWTLWVLSLMVVSIREIWYFGGEYKRECGITLFMLPLMLDPNTIIPFTFPMCALGMNVLAAGKVFEPCAEDLSRSKSEFLSK